MTKKNIFISILFFTSICILYACNNNGENTMNHNADSSTVHITPNDTMVNNAMPKENDMMKSMMATMELMNNSSMTNNFDIDFANSMIIHHQAAIDMSELEIAKGGDVQIINMAKNIIKAQKAEITQMKNFVANYTLYPSDKIGDTKINTSAPKNILTDEMKSMMDKMHNMKMTGNTDDDFVMLMIPHHASAVKMAKYEIAYGKETQLKNMAQKIIIDQNKEIAKFVGWSTKLNN